MHPHMLRHTFVTTMLDVGVDRRDVQIAAHHADPRTTVRYDRPRTNLDRHPNYILAAYMAPGTGHLNTHNLADDRLETPGMQLRARPAAARPSCRAGSYGVFWLRIRVVGLRVPIRASLSA